MSLIDRAKKHYTDQLNSCIEVPEWGEKDKPLKVYYDPPTLNESFMLNAKSENNYQLMLCHLIARKAKDANGERLFEDTHAIELYRGVDERVVSYIGLAMKNHVSVKEQVKN